MKLDFEKKAVEKAERDFMKLELTPEHVASINLSSGMFEKALGLKSIAVKGFISYAVRDWQYESQLKLEDLDDLPMEIQMQHRRRISDFLLEYLVQIVPPGQKSLLLDIIQKALDRRAKDLAEKNNK